MSDQLIALCALAAGVLMILAWQRIADPAQARAAHQLASAGVLLAVLAAVTDKSIESPGVVWLALAIGAGAGVWVARRTVNQQIPNMLVLANGLGAGAALLVTSLAYAQIVHTGAPTPLELMLPIQLVLLLGGVTLGAAVVVWRRLSGRWPNQPRTYRWQWQGNFALGVLVVALGLFLTRSPDHPWWFTLAALLAVTAGVLGALRLPAGDLPLVTLSLGAATGLAAAGAGLVLEQDALVLVGGFIGAAGVALTRGAARRDVQLLRDIVRRAFWRG